MSEANRSTISLLFQGVTVALLVVVIVQLGNIGAEAPRAQCRDPRPDAFAVNMFCDELVAELLYEQSNDSPASVELCTPPSGAASGPQVPCQQLMVDLLDRISAQSGGSSNVEGTLSDIVGMLDEICSRLDDLDTGPSIPSPFGGC